jgi:hypothetical protein
MDQHKLICPCQHMQAGVGVCANGGENAIATSFAVNECI